VTATLEPAAVRGDIRGFIAARHPRCGFADTDDIFALGFVSSLFAMQLVLFLEQHFAVQIPNEELSLANLRSVAAMAELVLRCRHGG
jgi:methoxymalonate biosynthesis acyl carrier protein